MGQIRRVPDLRTEPRRVMNTNWKWTPANEKRALRRFGVESYRPGQRELIQAVLSGNDALGIMPTGSGKSLCYQLPALFLPRPVLVVSPLISLMQDQQDKLAERDIPAAKLNSTLNAGEERQTVDDIEQQAPELVYITPERLENPDYLNVLKSSGVSLFVVDEAHCISQWGHDFRPAYLTLADAIAALGHPPVLALTATATPEVAGDILKQLNLSSAKVVDLGIRRRNLFFQVMRTVNEEIKRSLLGGLVRDQSGSGIVYVPTVRQADELWRYLVEQGVNAARYHAKMRQADRESAQQAFMNDEVAVMVATKAFGLGIDKPDIRFVIHYAVPDSVETYVQEAGRAGRDGKTALALLLYRLEDRRVQSYFLGGRYPRREEALAVYQAAAQCTGQTPKEVVDELVELTGLPNRKVKAIVASLKAAGIIEKSRRQTRQVREFGEAEFSTALDEYETRHDRDRERLDAMMLYGQTTECRARYLLRYFHEDSTTDCGHCDNCCEKEELAAPTAFASEVAQPVPA